MPDFVFNFGYHGPDAYPAVSEDPDFDFESTGAVIISANSEAEAVEWGLVIARWYTSAIHLRTQPAYSWSEANYAVFVERIEETERDTTGLPRTSIGKLPGLHAMRRVWGD